MSAVRVVVVDDHPIFRDRLRAALTASPDVAWVGEAADGTAALDVTDRLAPDVVVMDLNLPRLDGVEATRRITVRPSPPAVLVVTMLEDEESLFAAVRAGASGYLLKGADQRELLEAVRAVARRDAVFGRGVARRVLTHFSSGAAQQDVPLPELSIREREVLDLVAQGQGNQAVARRLGLSPKTVRNNMSTILAKLRAGDRGEAVARARAAGLGAGYPSTQTRRRW